VSDDATIDDATIDDVTIDDVTIDDDATKGHARVWTKSTFQAEIQAPAKY